MSFNLLQIWLQLLITRQPHHQKILGQKARLAFEQAGGAYIKLGQIIALRVDLFPPAFCTELRQLLDQVPAFPFSEAQNIIETELHQPLTTIFSEFNPTPIASASLGQIHQATLRNTQTQVAVKIQRPHIQVLITQQMAELAQLMKTLDFFTFRHYHLQEVVTELTDWLDEELDYTQEAQNLLIANQREVKTNLFFDLPTKIKCPQLYPEFSTARVLTMEFMTGKTLNQLIDIYQSSDRRGYENLLHEGYDMKTVIKNATLNTFFQIYINGFFNADPHPANIIIDHDNTLKYVDFGLVGFLNVEERNTTFRFMRAVMMLNEAEVITQAVSIFEIPTAQQKSFQQQMQKFFQHAQLQPGLDVDYSQRSTQILLHLLKVIRRLKYPIPVKKLKLIRSCLTYDGIAKATGIELPVREICEHFPKIILAGQVNNAREIIQNPSDNIELVLRIFDRVETALDSVLYTNVYKK